MTSTSSLQRRCANSLHDDMIIDSSRLAISLKFDRHEAFAIIDSELTKISEQVTRTPFQTYFLEAEHHVIVAAVFVIIAESNGREPREPREFLWLVPREHRHLPLLAVYGSAEMVG